MSGTRTKKEPSPNGRVPGVKGPSTPAVRRHARVANYRTGRYAKNVTIVEAHRSKLMAIDEDAPALIEMYTELLTSGDLTKRNQQVVDNFVGNELILQRYQRAILEDGVTVMEESRDPETGQVYERMKAHPLTRAITDMTQALGYTADQQQLTPKSQGEGARDKAQEAYLRREKLLRDGGSEGLPPPE